jgi:hypothetical protein
MSYNRRPKAEGHETFNNTSITASGARDVESTQVMLNETGEGVRRSLTSSYAYSCKPCSRELARYYNG